MPTGYGYVRDSEPLAVDWSAVSKKFTDQLKTQEEQRLATKKDILDKRTEFTKTLLNKPVGQNTALNRIMSGFADQLREYSLTNLDDFKAKNKDLKAYNAWENNAKSGTELLFEAVESFNTNFDNYAKRAQDGTASQIEVFMHELTQDYTDFGSVSLDVDPKTGEVIISELGEDGNPTGKTLDVSQLGYFSKFTRDKYNIDTEVSNIAKGLGTKFLQDSEGNSLKYQGMLYEEIVNNDELMKGLDTEISALIDEGFELESVLADSLNYSIVTDKTDDETKLFFNQDTNQFEISETQKKAAFDHVKQKLMNALNIDRREPKAEDEPTPQEIQTNLIRKFDFVARNKDKIPPEYINQVLTPEEQVQFTKYIEDSGVDENTLGNVLEQVTTFVDFTNLKEGETGNYKKRAINFLNNVGETFGFTFNTQGNVGNNLTGRGAISIQFGDDTQKVSLRKSDGTLKSDQELLNDVVLKMYQFKPLKTLVTDITLRASQPQGSKLLD